MGFFRKEMTLSDVRYFYRDTDYIIEQVDYHGEQVFRVTAKLPFYKDKYHWILPKEWRRDSQGKVIDPLKFGLYYSDELCGKITGKGGVYQWVEPLCGRQEQQDGTFVVTPIREAEVIWWAACPCANQKILESGNTDIKKDSDLLLQLAAQEIKDDLENFHAYQTFLVKAEPYRCCFNNLMQLINAFTVNRFIRIDTETEESVAYLRQFNPEAESIREESILEEYDYRPGELERLLSNIVEYLKGKGVIFGGASS